MHEHTHNHHRSISQNDNVHHAQPVQADLHVWNSYRDRL